MPYCVVLHAGCEACSRTIVRSALGGADEDNTTQASSKRSLKGDVVLHLAVQCHQLKLGFSSCLTAEKSGRLLGSLAQHACINSTTLAGQPLCTSLTLGRCPL